MTTIDFAKIFHSLPLPACIIQDGYFKMVNPKIAGILEYTAEETLKLQCVDLIHPEDRPWLLKRLRECIAAGVKECGDYEFRAAGRNGEFIYLRGFFSAIEFDGRAAILCQILDITEQKQSEIKLHKNEELLSAIAVNTIDMICLTGADLIIRYATPSYKDWLGYAPEEMIGKSIFNWIHPDDLPKVKACVGTVLNNKSSYSLVFRHMHVEGRYVWLESHGNPLPDENGKVNGAIFTTRDVTERKMTEENLRNVNQQLCDIIEFLPDATFVIDQENKVIAWNRAIEEMTGVHKSKILGKGNYAYATPLYGKPRPMLIDLLEAGDRELKKYCYNVARKGNTLYDTFFIPFLNQGEGAFIRGAASPLFDSEGNRIGAIESIRDITAQKHMEKDLLRITTAVENTGNAIVMNDERGEKVTYCNKSFTKLFGYTADELNAAGGMQSLFFDSESARKLYHSIVEGRTWGGELDLRSKNNKKTPVYLHADAVRDETGNIIGLFGVYTDITERKLAEEKLRAVNQQLFDIIEFLPDATFVIDRERKVIAWNRAMEKMTGTPKEDILGKGDSLYGTPFYDKPTQMLINLIFASNKEHELEYSFFERQGNLLFAENFTPALYNRKGAVLWGTASPLFDSEGNLIGAIESIRDITARKRMEEELQRINKAVENSSNAVVMTDITGKFITYCNKSFQDLFGFTAQELNTAGGIHVLFPNSATAEEVYKTLISGHSWKGESSKKTRQNEIIQVYMHGDALRDETGRVNGLFAIYTDITKLKLAEIEIKKAKETAETANRAKSTFMANMSHEIRTPVNAMLGMSELLLDMPMDEVQKKFVSTIHDSGQHLLTIINDILDLSKIEAGKIVVETVTFDPLSLFEEFVKVMATKAGKKNLAFKTSIAYDGPPSLDGDPMRMRQVLFNFIDNAVKFTDHGGIELHATVKRQDENHVAMRFEVSDTGIGIDSKNLDKLFRPFSQINGSTTRTHGGTGLGLAISSRLVKLMGGEIGVESKKGQGSTFWFTVPLKVNVAEKEQSECKKTPLPNANKNHQPAHARAKTLNLVLVVEDNPVNQELLLAQLDRLGYDAHVVSTGQEAVDAVLATSYALILMDCQMPVMDGFEATRAIREKEPVLGRYTPIIATTAYAMKGDREKCIRAGMNDYLSKPVSLAQLQNKLERWSLPPGPTRTRDANTIPALPEHVDHDVIDQETLEGLRQLQTDNMPDIFSSLINIYLKNTPALISALEEAIEKKDSDALRFVAHSLKSCSSNLGALRLSALAQELEDMGAQGDAGNAVGNFELIVAEFDKVKETLKTYLI